MNPSAVMNDIDLNLLPALDALLSEGSVTGAARRLGLSTSAMSRSLARLRVMTGDALLVRAGSRLVPTPRAAAMRQQVQDLAQEARRLLGPATDAVDLATLERSFVIRANEGFVALFAAPLIAAVSAVAPGVRLHFVQRQVKSAADLRQGQVDLEIGVLGRSGPEVRTRAVFRDHFVGVARAGHPLLEGGLTAQRYAGCGHVLASRKAALQGPADIALAALGLQRRIVAIVPGFADALGVVRASDLVTQVPRSLLGARLEAAEAMSSGLAAFALPLDLPGIVVSAMWHPRVDADPAHRWLRDTLVAICRDALPDADA